MADSGGAPQAYRIEAFDPQVHDRTAFSCGAPQIDNFLKLSARKQQRDGFVRVRVMVPRDGSVIAGFYAINAHSIDAGDFGEDYARRAPRHGRTPAAYISVIGVDVRLQGRSLGRVLLADALKQIVAAASILGTAVTVLDILDDGDAEAVARRERCYRSFGFIPFPSQSRRLFLPVETVRKITG